ncbi:MAG: lipopolysaccharide kinase InaA family protein, partial [Planctomycetota bacterium]|nr:lipopolysaccharide kinase InaA family protein [Planctomycetota bacterium]
IRTERRPMTNAAAIAVGKLLGRMHAAGISHRDLKSQNVMVRRTAEGGYVASVIDLDGVTFLSSITAARRWKDLARLAADAATWAGLSRSTRLRFLIAYAYAAGLPKCHKAAWRQVSAKVLARLDRRHVA